MRIRRRTAPAPSPPGAVRATPTLAERIAALAATTYSQAPITVDQLPIVVGLANLHADVIAQFPLYAEDARTHVRVLNTPDVLEQPDPTEDRADTVHAIVQGLWYTGNAPCLISPGGDSIRVQNPNRVSVAPSFDPFDDRRIDGWYVHGVPVRARDVLLFKINDDPRRGPLGHSPLAQCWQAVENYAWAYRYLADYYRSGGNPSLLLKSRNASDTTQVDELMALWIAARQAGRPAVIPWDMEVEGSPVPQDIADTVEVLKFCASEVCRGTNTPPSIGNAEIAASLTYSTTLDELRRWLVLSLQPTWLSRIERGFTKLLPDGLNARFDISELPRLDVFGAQPSAPAPAAAAPPATGVPTRPMLEVVA